MECACGYMQVINNGCKLHAQLYEACHQAFLSDQSFWRRTDADIERLAQH